MKIRSILTAALALLLATGCNAQNKQENTNTITQSNNKTMNKIVIFFSHAGDNYSVGNIEVGNTKIVADYISEITGADQYEIVTHKYDGMAYMPLIELAKKEAADGELPPYEGAAPDLSKYDTVFIGGPVWWGTYPQVMFTLFKDIDLAGKTVIPFTTDEGSGLANCVSDVKKAFPKANVTKGFSIYGHEVRTGKAKVEKWLSSFK
ncbi:MAG: flavodoxin [Bacteroidales bacterium]|nr:flavodoxin [Bacteroidales bacterium]